MKESDRLANQAFNILVRQGWPLEAIKELANLLISAGIEKCLEEQRAGVEKVEAMVQKAYVVH